MGSDKDKLLWGCKVLEACILECDNDVDAALVAADYILSNEPVGVYQGNTKPGMDVDIGQPKSAPGPAFPVDPSDYPRNKSNQFVSKKLLAKASRSSEEHIKLRSSLPQEQHHKVDKAVSHLQSGGTVNHPSEHPNLGVDTTGEIANKEWAYYQYRLDNRKDWVKRNSDRKDKRTNILEATKLVRDGSYYTKLHKTLPNSPKEAISNHDTYLDDIVDSLEKISTNNSQLRELDRVRHNANIDISKNFDKDTLIKVIEDYTSKLHSLFEDILEEEHKRLDEEETYDPEPEVPEEPSEDATNHSPHFSLEEINIALSTPQVTWQPYVGPRGGKGWKSSTGRIVYRNDKPLGREVGEEDEYGRIKGSRIPTVSGGGTASERNTTPIEREVDEEVTRPSDKTADTVRASRSISTGNETPRPASKPTVPIVSRGATEQRAVLENVNRELDRYSHYFDSKKQPDISEWFGELKEHINTVGADKALASLGGQNETSNNPDDSLPQEKVQYKGTGYFKGDKNLKFLEEYLDEVGIKLVTNNRYSKTKKLIASAPIVSANKAAKEGDLVAKETNIQTKLEESKLLPGLESSEDIHTVVGGQVSQFTPDVLNKLDETYGKGKWIVKSYGDQAYAGFGVLFPQRLAEVKRVARQTIYENGKQLKKLGYSLSRGASKQVDGVIDTKSNTSYKFGTTEYNNIQDPKIKKLARGLEVAAPEENGARLPTTPEEALRQDYGILLTKNNSGKVIGLIDSEGSDIPYNSPKWRKLVNDEYSNIGKDLERAIEANKHKSKPDARFMVQPAFKVVGVTELDRALGFTWETSNEGRVHVATNNGKASVVPYATLAGRADAFPVVFHNDDTRAMEKAVQDTIDALPESERSGQTYAPDVIKTTQGWKVVELNASSEFGESLWLEENPFVIDAYVSHLSNRKPSHVNFIQSLLQGKASQLKGLEDIEEGTGISSLKGKDGKNNSSNSDVARLRSKLQTRKGSNLDEVTLSTDDQGHDHAPAGSGKGGQFVKKGGGGSSVLKTTNPDKLPTKIDKVGGPGGIGATIKGAVSGAVRGALIGGKAGATGTPEKVSKEEHNKAVERALNKFEKMQAMPPTNEELAQNLAGIEKLGANIYRRNLVGNTSDRRRRREKLLLEFGDGTHCPCLYCGVLLTHGTLEQDKIFTTAEGGRYRPSNIVPACKRCNNLRSDMTFSEAIEKVIDYDRDTRTA